MKEKQLCFWRSTKLMQVKFDVLFQWGFPREFKRNVWKKQVDQLHSEQVKMEKLKFTCSLKSKITLQLVLFLTFVFLSKNIQV